MIIEDNHHSLELNCFSCQVTRINFRLETSPDSQCKRVAIGNAGNSC
jgi:hypothetical protein